MLQMPSCSPAASMHGYSPKYEPVILGRCIAELRGGLDADDVAQDVKVRLWGELTKGKSYAVPFRVVVHKVIGWTLRDHWTDEDYEEFLRIVRHVSTEFFRLPPDQPVRVTRAS